MKQVACNYSAIRFLPYRETGEFVNVGVVVSCPEIAFFDFKLTPKRLRRVKGFFPELDHELLTSAIQTLDTTLKSRRSNGELLTDNREFGEAAKTVAMEEFRFLLKRRETLLHFADPGALLTTDPRKTLLNLYDRLVNRTFAQLPQYQEVIMRNRLAGWLKEWKLSAAYRKNFKVGNDQFHTSLPFVHSHKGVALCAIKPLDLNRSDTTAIYDHGDAWVQRMHRLGLIGKMPERMIFTVSMPPEPPQKKAAQEICEALKYEKVTIVSFDETNQIHQLASLD